MKAVEAPGGISIFLTNDEFKMWEALGEETWKSNMTERQQYLAQSLVDRGVAKRNKKTRHTFRIRSSLGEWKPLIKRIQQCQHQKKQKQWQTF